jgi:hypothetical protein
MFYPTGRSVNGTGAGYSLALDNARYGRQYTSSRSSKYSPTIRVRPTTGVSIQGRRI